ncbi:MULTISPECIES: nuclear transport factor 2 family protein [unclassified Uliginosibacterium]|uniref:nuclear transport factor 2 family protein n=1 Tax=unclassified Uliginosibacterium TaxID=2621521 RepID=UPI000C7D321A|nr:MULTISPECIES: nuclear transport factor 2 family protein [unclassified Uliginosibacterium]MDO6385386.1 nuclear transport factor 2 family protein [Uliginosibacterium sp. 31-12]PLK46991.1 hypothetical protein C0V76_19225 [Uliginosibacterium sp. TH139]
MQTESLCKAYLTALNESNLDGVLSLFAPEATVISPLYGVIEANSFYRALFSDTQRSETRLLNIFLPSGEASSVALHFEYIWTLSNSKQVQFECVDVFELTPDGQQFTKLTIIYDTAPIRSDFDGRSAAHA